MTEQKVEQRTEHLPIDPRSCSINNFLPVAILADGRDKYEGEKFVYFTFGEGDLSSTLEIIRGWYVEGYYTNDLVIGVGIKLEESQRKRKVVFDHTRLGIWLKINQHQLVGNRANSKELSRRINE